MNLKEVFDQLAYGELSQLSIGQGDNGSIAPKDYDRMIGHVNLALTALYKRFYLKKGSFQLSLQPEVYTYSLKSKNAVSRSRTGEDATHYIVDTRTSRFSNDILKVERVWVPGFELPLNDLADPYTVSTPNATTLVFPKDIVDQVLSLPTELKTLVYNVDYRANHVAIEPDGITLDPEDVELELPATHLEALLLNIASRVHTPVGMPPNQANLGNTYFAKYEKACQDLEEKNFQIDRVNQEDRLHRAGWV